MHATHKALMEYDGQFRMLVDSVQDYAIFMLDSSGKVVTWNTGAERIKGYQAEEIIGNHFSCFYSADDLMQGRPFRELEIAQASGRYEEEGWRVRKDGTRFWANVVISAIRDDSGELIGFAKVTRDLTERKRNEDLLQASHENLERRVRDRTAELAQLNEELRASHERYRLIIETAKDYAIFTLDSAGHVTTWNAGASRIYGYSSNEIIGQHFSRFFTPADVVKRFPHAELLEATETGRFSEEAWRVRKNGSMFWANGTLTPLRDETGSLQGFVKIVRDLTERKQFEIERQEALTALQLRDRAIRAVSHGIFISDPTQPDNPIVYVSPGFEVLTGYQSSEVMGRSCEFLNGPKTDVEVVNKVREAMRNGQKSSVELINYRKDGTAFWCEQVVSPVLDEQGRLVQFVGVQADVTQRRNLEEQLRQSQKMEAIGQLAGGVAHDFNNLLTIILVYVEYLIQQIPSSDSNHFAVDGIGDAANRAADLTRQLLMFGRRNFPEVKSLDLNELVMNTEKLLKRIIGEDISMSIVLDQRIGQTKVDPGHMSQVLMNLVVNARDAMPLGGQLTIETKWVELDEPYVNTHVEVDAGRYVLLSVSDTGTGMTPEVRSRIFDPYFTTKDVGKGTGLGLSVVHGIVKQSHGHIGAYTELGVGTTFKIYLPAVKADLPAPLNPLESIKVSGGHETILLVEDEEIVRHLTQQFLQIHGYTVLTASNGGDAMRMVNEQKGSIDLLLTDVVMPELSGRQLADALAPRFPQMKILYVSGYTDDTVIRHGILGPNVAFLEKPYTQKLLLARVRKLLDEVAAN